MSEHVYQKVELTGSSKASVEDAIQNALEKASQTLKTMRWFEVLETRGYIEQGKVAYYQVTLKVGYTLD
jgi:flavin-binding protein dodecin